MTVGMAVVFVACEHLLRGSMQLILAKSAGVADAAITIGLSSNSTEALTPLCRDMGSLQLSSRLRSPLPVEVTPAGTINGDDGCNTLSPARAFSLPTGISSDGETPAFPRTGWKCQAPGDQVTIDCVHSGQHLGLTLCILA